MALSEQEELEMLRLRKQKAMSTGPAAAVHPPPEAPKAAFPSQGYRFGRDRDETASAPYGAFNDAMLAGADWAGGKVTDMAAPYMEPENAAKLGYATNVGLQAAPMLLSGGAGAAAGKALLKPPIQGYASNLMNSALKPTLAAHESGDAAVAVKTMLDRGINATPGGVDKIRALIDGLNSQIKNKVATSTKLFKKSDVLDEVGSLKDRLRMQVNPNADLQTAQRAADEFANHPIIKNTNDIPVQLGQRMKQETYRKLGDNAYQAEIPGAAREAQMALARGLRKGVAGAVPEVAALNAEEAALLKTLNVAERRAFMEMNNNPGGLAWITSSPSKFAGFMADKSGLFKSLMARMLYSGGGTIGGTVGGATGMGLYGVGRIQDQPAKSANTGSQN
jgi:hypothetical protein